MFEGLKGWYILQDISISGLLITSKHLNNSLDKLHSLHSMSIGAVKVSISFYFIFSLAWDCSSFLCSSLDTKCEVERRGRTGDGKEGNIRDYSVTVASS